jgi:hypothetical protein
LNHTILFQPVAFYQIVSNIISNAIKYNDKEVLNLRICFDQDTSSLSFKDNGPEEKYHTKIFEMFQTLGKSFNGESRYRIKFSYETYRNDVSINITNNSDVGCDFVISNLEIASNKASLLPI